MKRHFFSNYFEKSQRAYIYVRLTSKRKRVILRELNWQNLSKQLWPNTCKLLRILLGTSNCIREKSFCTSYKPSCNQETIFLLVCENLEHKGEGSQGVFKYCKGFTMIVKNLKWVTWGLDIVTGNGRTSINQVCNSLFPYLIYFIATDFVLHV